ncbi:MAG TPA: uroporphyrinogen-III synthase [Terriglobales bacterium]|nr:uroporphyrinogen-III synthase [Terriglobales bacterium]
MSGFNGARVLSFESRRAEEIAKLIGNHGGVPIIAPSTQEILTPSEEERQAIRGIVDGEFEAIIFMTGVGARALIEASEKVCAREEFLRAIGRAQVIVRGPKPAAVMREFGVPIALTIPEPNTWREIISTLDENRVKAPIQGRKVAVQEHGEPSRELYAALRERGAQVTPISVYRWDLPEDLGPLKNAVREVSEQKIDVVLFTSSIQLIHALRVAKQMGSEERFLLGLQKTFVASIGPICSESLRENGVCVDFEPSHPKMGFLVKEAGEKSGERIQPAKRS